MDHYWINIQDHYWIWYHQVHEMRQLLTHLGLEVSQVWHLTQHKHVLKSLKMLIQFTFNSNFLKLLCLKVEKGVTLKKGVDFKSNEMFLRWLRIEWLASPPTLLEVSSEKKTNIWMSEFVWRKKPSKNYYFVSIHPGEVNMLQRTLFQQSSIISSGFTISLIWQDNDNHAQWWLWNITGQLLSRDGNPMMHNDAYYRAVIARGAKLIKDHGGGNLPVEKYDFYSELW